MLRLLSIHLLVLCGPLERHDAFYTYTASQQPVIVIEPPSHDGALSSTSGLVWFCGLLNLGNHHLESLSDVEVLSGTGLYPATFQGLPQLLALLCSDLALLAHVALVANYHDGYRFGSLCIVSLLS